MVEEESHQAYRRPTIMSIDHGFDDSKDEIDDSSSNLSKGKAKTLIH